MAATVAITERDVQDSQLMNLCTFAWDATYPAGGESFTANQVGMGTILAVIPIGTTSGFSFEYDATNAKLKAYYVDNNAAGDSAQIEVAVGDTAALTGVITPLLVIGH